MPARLASRPGSPSRLRIAIVGAGLGGLTLAQLLSADPNIDVTLYERSASLDDRLTGYRVMLSGTTLTTLKAKLSPAVWAAVALSIGEQPSGGQRIEFSKGSGERLFTWDSAGARDQFSVSRWQFRQGLLQQTDGFLKVGKCFERYQEMPKGGVRVFFADGSVEECDLLVGADGWNSRIKKQLLPYAGVKEVDMAVIYFKVPLTKRSLKLCGSESSSMIFCKDNQTIFLGIWQNPLAPYATRYNTLTIEPEESYIMLGVGSPISHFRNRRVSPDKLSSMELKAEILARTNAPDILSRFAELCSMACENTAYVHMVRKSATLKPWGGPGRVTLLGDSVFNMSNMLGRGANCALADAVSLADTLSHYVGTSLTPPGTGIVADALGNYSHVTSHPQASEVPKSLSVRLAQYIAENIARRTRERKRSAMMQQIVSFGENKLRSYAREVALPYALKRIDGLDKEVHHAYDNNPEWVLDEEAWTEGSRSVNLEAEDDRWGEELRWEDIYREQMEKSSVSGSSVDGWEKDEMRDRRKGGVMSDEELTEKMAKMVLLLGLDDPAAVRDVANIVRNVGERKSIA